MAIHTTFGKYSIIHKLRAGTSSETDVQRMFAACVHCGPALDIYGPALDICGAAFDPCCS